MRKPPAFRVRPFPLLMVLVFVETFYGIAAAQELQEPPITSEPIPPWAVLMYKSNPNVWQVDNAYDGYYREHPLEPTSHTQYYKHWRRAVDEYIDDLGFIRIPDIAEKQLVEREYLRKIASARATQSQVPAARRARDTQWESLGPFETFSTGASQTRVSWQANVYSIDQSITNPDVLYCGTEGSEIFKSIDRGQSWFPASRNYATSKARAIKVSPVDENIVYAGGGDTVLKTTDGAITWSVVLTVSGLGPNDIAVNPLRPEVVLVASNKGLYRSEDGGSTWSALYTDKSYDVKIKPDDPLVVYVVKNNLEERQCEFFKSTDGGATFNQIANGWYHSEDPDRRDAGAHLAVTPADPNRIYAVLIGEAKPGDNGYIGVYRSDDAGESWTLPNPPDGGPYSTEHPNLASYHTDGTGYTQGFYDLAIGASATNPDELLIGFLSLWKSSDGATTFTKLGGYGGSLSNIHPDIQNIKVNGNDTWVSSDGGINYSTDFFVTHQSRMKGVSGSDFWGFDTGWQEDVVVGGRYHNGNTAHYENYPTGQYLRLGGGEKPTGYVNPAESLRTYFSDIGGKLLPRELSGTVTNFRVDRFPNESYSVAESSRMMFDPRYPKIIYLGKDQNLWWSEDGGSTFNLVNAFGDDPGNKITYIEIGRSNPNVIYASQRPPSGSLGRLWKTTDAGITWQSLALPAGNSRKILLSLSATDENTLWIAYAQGGNGQKAFKTTDGGSSWTNLTTALLNNESVDALMHHGGSDGGIYLGTSRTVFYRNNSLEDWQVFDNGIPAAVKTNILKPFYRDGKIRLGAYGKGLWQSDLYESAPPVAQPMADRWAIHCGEEIHFQDYSILYTAGGASWNWSLPGGTPSTSTEQNPVIVYGTQGAYDVLLTVADQNGTSTKTVREMIVVAPPGCDSDGLP